MTKKVNTEGVHKKMDKVFKTLGFWTAIFATMFYVGGMNMMAYFFVAQTGFFRIVGILKINRKNVYVYIRTIFSCMLVGLHIIQHSY